jgi:predicted aspartyl protease
VSESFNGQAGPILINVRIWGPEEAVVARLALDTGATSTIISPALLRLAGYDPLQDTHRIRMTTASGVEYVSRVVVDRIEALGQARNHFPAVSHTLPPSASVDGLLGLDFFRGQRLTIDFRSGEILLD